MSSLDLSTGRSRRKLERLESESSAELAIITIASPPERGSPMLSQRPVLLTIAVLVSAAMLSHAARSRAGHRSAPTCRIGDRAGSTGAPPHVASSTARHRSSGTAAPIDRRRTFRCSTGDRLRTGRAASRSSSATAACSHIDHFTHLDLQSRCAPAAPGWPRAVARSRAARPVRTAIDTPSACVAIVGAAGDYRVGS